MGSDVISELGFESGGQHSPSIIDPWSIIGDDSLVKVSTDVSSCFKTNSIALRMEVLCDNDCPLGGVGIYNPGYWGMVTLITNLPMFYRLTFLHDKFLISLVTLTNNLHHCTCP